MIVFRSFCGKAKIMFTLSSRQTNPTLVSVRDRQDLDFPLSAVGPFSTVASCSRSDHGAEGMVRSLVGALPAFRDAEKYEVSGDKECHSCHELVPDSLRDSTGAWDERWPSITTAILLRISFACTSVRAPRCSVQSPVCLHFAGTAGDIAIPSCHLL